MKEDRAIKWIEEKRQESARGKGGLFLCMKEIGAMYDGPVINCSRTRLRSSESLIA